MHSCQHSRIGNPLILGASPKKDLDGDKIAKDTSGALE
jgi:hypothetical protein